MKMAKKQRILDMLAHTVVIKVTKMKNTKKSLWGDAV